MVDTNAVVQDEIVDPTLLRVLGNKGSKDGERDGGAYVKTLANAILKVYSKHKLVKLRCVGAAAVNNAAKSIAIAQEDAERNGLDLVVKNKFTNVNFDGQVKTGILKIVFANGDKPVM